MSYDPKCEELVRHFLPEKDWPDSELIVQVIAQQIQDCIENALENLASIIDDCKNDIEGDEKIIQ
jgi:hypothetical protein